MAHQTVALNRKARFEYFISDVFEAGLVLTGTEIKSIREGKVNLKDAYIRIINQEVYVVGMHISPYSHAADINAIDPIRTRKLLLRRQEAGRLAGLILQKGLTCVPLALYLKRGMAKLEIGVAKAKKRYDKRQALKEKAHAREMRQALKKRGS